MTSFAMHRIAHGHLVYRCVILPVLALITCSGASLPAQTVSAEGRDTAPSPRRRALLVGCTSYPELEAAFPDQRVRLEGPSGDVELIARTLVNTLGLEEANITRLVGWPDDPAVRPTRANILGSLDRIAEDAAEGDWVCIYFAGHGTQQVTSGGQELDGFDEVFLPADAGARVDSRGRIPNGIADDELGRRLAAIREAGAEVWFVADCCHSGSLVRGEDAVALRGLPPDLFAPRRPRRPRQGPPRSLAESDLDGLVGMYAVQSDQKAPEMLLPPGSSEARPHGLFTYLLCQELIRGGAGMTYDELHQRVVAAYQAHPYRAAVPAIEGHASRVIASGEERTAPALLATVGAGEIESENNGLALNLGSLAGVDRGAFVEVLAPGSTDDVIARVEVTDADPFESRGAVVTGELLPGVYAARVAERAWSESGIDVALVDLEEQPLADGEIAQTIARELAIMEGSLRLVSDPSTADWLILCDGERFWVRPAATTGGFDIGEVARPRLAQLFQGIVKTRGLVRLAVAEGGGLTSDLQLTVERRARVGASAQPVGAGESLVPGEQIRIRLAKTSDAEYSVTVLYLDAAFGVTCLFPLNRASARLVASAREALDTGWLPVVDSTLGAEHILVLAVPRAEGEPNLDFSWLARDDFRDRGASSSALDEFLLRLASGQVTRTAAQGSYSLDHAMVSMRTEWPRLGPTPWRRARFAELEAPRVTPTTPFPSPLGKGERMQRFRIRSGSVSMEMALVGGEASPDAVFFDLVTGSTTSESGPGGFDAESAFLFTEAGDYAYYDRRDGGTFDLVLFDGNRDGAAERMWTAHAEGWEERSGIHIPFLSQSYLEFLRSRELSVAASLAFGNLVQEAR